MLYVIVVLDDHRRLAPSAPVMRRDSPEYSPEYFCQELANSDWSALWSSCVTVDEVAELLNLRKPLGPLSLFV